MGHQGDTPRPPQPPDDLITPKTAARIMDTHISTIYRWISEGRLKSYLRAGCRRLISKAELMGLIRADDTKAKPPAPIRFGTEQRAQQARQRHAREVLRAAGFDACQG